jgi:transposase
MAKERLSMRKTREILREKWELGLSHRAVMRSLGVSLGMVSNTVARAQAAGLRTWAEVEALSDEALEERLYGPARAARKGDRPPPDPVWIHTERQKPGVTLELLHMEYREQHPNGYGYTSFCAVYRKWLARQKLTMRQVHRGGEKLFVDYSGKKPHIADRKTGEVHEVELFVAVLGASNYTYAEATRSQKIEDWIGSHVRALAALGGVPAVIVPDQLRSAVSRPCRYEPGAQRTYAELAHHYGTAIVPARPRKPRDKAKVEVAVQVVQRWILARLRHQSFFSLDALNERIRELCDELNERPMRRYGGKTRRQLFTEIDRPQLRPLPAEPFVYATWRHARVNIDYHVTVDQHYYSAPHALVHEQVEVRLTALTVELFHKGRRVAAHVRSYAPGRHTTESAHMPKAHQKHLEWSPSRLIAWAAQVGPHVEALVRSILDERPHPEQGYRSCLGILRLEKRHGGERLDAACARALRAGARSYRHVASILRHGLDRLPLDEDSAAAQPVTHDNVRGPDYYH